MAHQGGRQTIAASASLLADRTVHNTTQTYSFFRKSNLVHSADLCRVRDRVGVTVRVRAVIDRYAM